MAKRKGAVAAGHADSAAAGRAVLEAGGNAVDAAIATAFAACVAEPTLTGLGAGGFMLIHSAKRSTQTLLDFFVAMPGQSLRKKKRELAKLIPVPVDFGQTVQLFQCGPASVAVPGFAAGLCAAHAAYATMPLRVLIEPAQELAKRGVVQTRQQEFLNRILYPILSLSKENASLFTGSSGPLAEGETFQVPELADTLEEIAVTRGRSLYEGDLAAALLTELDRGGGYITKADLEQYEVVERQPVRARYRDAEISTNPPPSSGGALIAHTLRLLDGFALGRLEWQSPAHLRHLIEAQISTAQARQTRFDAHVHEEEVLDRLLAEELMAADAGRLSNRLGNTTHLSVVDAAGNAVSMTSSNGSTAGVVVPGTGILLNNMLGEEDLNPGGFHKHPAGLRLPSMMSPTIVLKGDRPTLVLGSAGSNRIRSAIIGVITARMDFGKSISEAVEAPRVHVEAGKAQLEGGLPSATAAALSASGYSISLWKDPNLFFGGVQAVGIGPKGELTGHGDSRRSGACLVV
jgi:gamma-glutamyltranspeptidase/glutathione hydrolase